MKNKFNIIQKVFLLTMVLFCTFLFSQDDNELYASADEGHVLVLEPSYRTSRSNLSFEKRYHYLVARAYFKLLSQAQKSEKKLKNEYEKYVAKNDKLNGRGSSIFQSKLNKIESKYQGHSSMLTGLRSWNLFSQNRTGDMFYFMAENEERIYTMYERKLAEDKMVTYLIYKLADLYHLEGDN